jgi:hypothetical protein
MNAPRVFTVEQRAAAAFAAGSIRVAALVLKRTGAGSESLERIGAALWIAHDELVEIGGVTFARDAEARS